MLLADRICASPFAVIGSIGVISEVTDILYKYYIYISIYITATLIELLPLSSPETPLFTLSPSRPCSARQAKSDHSLTIIMDHELDRAVESTAGPQRVRTNFVLCDSTASVARATWATRSDLTGPI